METGILAYGSVIEDPGEEISAAELRRVAGVLTPFAVEFARESKTRKGAPTLVPVREGGARVRGCIIVVGASEMDAANMLYRREINQVGSAKTYKRPAKPTENSVLIEKVDGPLAGVETVLHTNIAATIAPLTAEHLAALAIQSAKQSEDGRDGISYLMNAKRHGIRTALSDAYEQEILRLANAASLEDALAKIRAGTASS